MKKQTKSRGFTIVELLIVIVIIAILAAITLVAYNGITNRAHASAAKEAAQNVSKKADIFNAENGYYPTLAKLTTIDTATPATTASSSWYLTGITAASAAMTAAPSKDNTIWYVTCTVPSTAAQPTGATINYWDFENKANASMTVGSC